MKIAVLKERRPDETRVAASPDTVKKLTQLGATVSVEDEAGVFAAFSNAAYEAAGASIAPDFERRLPMRISCSRCNGHWPARMARPTSSA